MLSGASYDSFSVGPQSLSIRFVRHLHVAVAVKQRSRGACPARLHCYALIRIDQRFPAGIALLGGLFGRCCNNACKVGQGASHVSLLEW